ncbi:unnamed protein product [Acanthoscelides obtectus]|uniref:Uncharacterized protein n=1 Tax=Acanthoscelides obtectus TaxID=200917 RepID=A0A9P0PQN3_ACAOB|nr:unnamed protein product [Acanthoscelides obtectus]CAH1995175.1 unnamed protein product [Acanthoscelides obtectus]CAK1641847.1 hypothetical protein AOBTE_LOCUS12674 [Acanthoscelides obtectus]CAK1649906.1 hypothetical protein AOBTE_LOCUS16484 [Acanthoscelides obtectus]
MGPSFVENSTQINPNLAKDSVGLGGRSKETINRKWDELAICLNTHGSGATKNGQCWRRVSLCYISLFILFSSLIHNFYNCAESYFSL